MKYRLHYTETTKHDEGECVGQHIKVFTAYNDVEASQRAWDILEGRQNEIHASALPDDDVIIVQLKEFVRIDGEEKVTKIPLPIKK